MPELGPGCGDIVLETPPVTTGSSKKPHPLSLFVRDRPDGIGSWSRVYLPEGDGVTAWLRAVSTSPSPSGCWVHCEPAAHALAHPVRAGGVREEGMWRWRWWPRSAEDDPNQLARCQYDPVEHRGGWVWRQRAETGR
jgi:hypothetical protein